MSARQAAPAAARLFEELLRRSPSSHPLLKGKVLSALVLPSRPSDKFVEVDPGFKGTFSLLRSELGPQGARTVAGDRHPLAVEHLETPLGEMGLNGDKAREAERMECVWQEIKAAQATGGVVQGRVLNPVNGGFAVGLAGLVAFLPAGRARQAVAAPVGSLQLFEVVALTDETRNVVLSAAPPWRSTEARPAFDMGRLRLRGGPTPSAPPRAPSRATARAARPAPSAQGEEKRGAARGRPAAEGREGTPGRAPRVTVTRAARANDPGAHTETAAEPKAAAAKKPRKPRARKAKAEETSAQKKE